MDQLYYLCFSVNKLPDLTLTKYSVFDGSSVENIMDKHGVFLRQLHRLGYTSGVYFHLLYYYNPDKSIPKGHHLSIIFYATSQSKTKLEGIREFLTTSVLSTYYEFFCYEIAQNFAIEEEKLSDGSILPLLKLTNISGAIKKYSLGKTKPEEVITAAKEIAGGTRSHIVCEIASDADAMLSFNKMPVDKTGRIVLEKKFAYGAFLTKKDYSLPAQNRLNTDGAGEINLYALSSFGDVTAPQVTFQSADGYRSNQASQNMESQFVPTDSSAPGASSSSPGSRQHSFADWLNPYNYTEDGHYIGEEQSWGYKPYGNDTSEYAATIMTPAQQALNSYMQANNYGKGDFAAYSKNAEWQRLHKAAHPASSLVDSLKGTALARQHLTEYMYAHNYTQADFATFSRDAEWQRLHQMAYPDSGVVAALVGSELARQHLREYMNEHNYSQTDYAIYSKDPEWQRLHRTAYPTAIANGKMTKRSISVTDAGTVNAKIKDRAHEFFGHFIGGTKGTSSTEHSASRPINQILAGAYDTPASSVDSLSQKFAALKDVSLNKLSKKNLETIVDIAITNLKSKYQTTASAERFSDLTRKISFIREADVKKELGRSYSPNICGYYSPATDTIRINIDGNASVGDLLATIDHETMHLLSKTHRNVEGGVLNSDIIFGNVGMNEGITEMYSIKNMQTVNPDYVSHSYTDEVDIMKKFESICGADKLLNAYMHNDLSHIRDDVNSCAGNRKAFEKLCNDIDILHHYNYVNPYAFDAPVQRANAKLRIYQRLEQYQKGKLAASDGAKITNAPMSSPPEKTNQGSAGSSVQYRFGFGKKKQSAVTTPSAESSATKKDERRSFAASLNAGISLEQQKADADARAVRQQHNNSSSSGDPYKEELERSLP